MPNPYLLPISKAAIKGSYPIEVAYQKTTHIIFPARIKDFDEIADWCNKNKINLLPV
jgi:hypothetical protein